MCTPGWVSHYRDNGAEKPSDSLWTRFRDCLRSRFHGICGYCEEEVDQSNASVDHFMPKSKFPELVYEWSNWVFACQPCNQSKGDKWPDDSYVDPCACSPSERPENFFYFDLYTGEILPKPGLSPERRSRAWQTINDVGLNKYHHPRRRLEQIRVVRSHILDFTNTQRLDVLDGIGRMACRSYELSSVTRQAINEYRTISQILKMAVEP